jgi:hypothetical protein
MAKSTDSGDQACWPVALGKTTCCSTAEQHSQKTLGYLLQTTPIKLCMVKEDGVVALSGSNDFWLTRRLDKDFTPVLAGAGAHWDDDAPAFGGSNVWVNSIELAAGVTSIPVGEPFDVFPLADGVCSVTLVAIPLFTEFMSIPPLTLSSQHRDQMVTLFAL